MALVLLLTLRKAVWHRLRPVAPPSPPHQCPGNAPAMPLQGPAGKHWWQPWRRSGLAGLARSVHQVFCVTRSRSHTLLQAPPPTPSLQAAHPRFSPTAAVLLACIYTSCVEALLLALSPRQSLSCSVPLTTDVNSRWRWHPPPLVAAGHPCWSRLLRPGSASPPHGGLAAAMGMALVATHNRWAARCPFRKCNRSRAKPSSNLRSSQT